MPPSSLGDTSAGRKMFSWFRTSSKPLRSLPSTAVAPWGEGLKKQGCPRNRKGFCRLRGVHKMAEPSAPAAVPTWRRLSSKSEPPDSQEGMSRPWPIHQPVWQPPKAMPPSAPLLWKPSPMQQGTPQKEERIFLTWPPFPSLPAASEPLRGTTTLKPQNQGWRRRVPLFRPLSPASSAPLLWESGPVKPRYPQVFTGPRQRNSFVWV